MSLPANILQLIEEDERGFKKISAPLDIPSYDPKTHVIELTRSPYYRALVVLRHHLRAVSDYYFTTIYGAKNLDLFMLTPSVSSPMGPGSDSEAIQIEFGNLRTYLVDSSQFGFEPLLLNGFEKVYCYLPSMRGEDPDQRHLNQFFHCEAEIKGTLNDLIPHVEAYIRILAEMILGAPLITGLLSKDSTATTLALKELVESSAFPVIDFEDAVSLLRGSKEEGVIHETEHGVDMTSKGERILLEQMGSTLPTWVKGYTRDRVPFYQKPSESDQNKVINADLLFPALIPGAFGGEIVGAGQRQDNEQEMRESLSRQGLSAKPYLWYIGLRNLPGYHVTSGFGLGIERFITWALCRSDIKEAIMYPRLKNVLTYP